MTGTVAISRALFTSAAFRSEPLSEREAWIWMIMEASWRDRTVRAGDAVVETQRGQFAASVRYMAKAWDWSPARVQRFLKRLQKLKMIGSKTDTGVTVITVCNYDKFQPGGKEADTAAIQDRYRTDTNKKKDEIREKKKRASLPFSEFWDLWPDKQGKQAAAKAWSKLAEDRQQAAMEAVRGGWFDRWRAAKPGANPIHASTFLNNSRWEDELKSELRAIQGGRPTVGETRIGRSGVTEEYHGPVDGWMEVHA